MDLDGIWGYATDEYWFIVITIGKDDEFWYTRRYPEMVIPSWVYSWVLATHRTGLLMFK